MYTIYSVQRKNALKEQFSDNNLAHKKSDSYMRYLEWSITQLPLLQW